MRSLLRKFTLLLIITVISGCQNLNDNMTFKVEPLNGQPENLNYYQSYVESRDLDSLEFSKKKVKVALFLPFSGKHRELGWHLFNAAALSLFDNDKDNNIELVLIDSKDTPQATARAFKEVIDRDIKVVIGPVFTQSIRAIAKDVEKNKITAISFSNNQELMGQTSDDSGVFLSGLLPETEIEKITAYALSQGKVNFAIIAPNNKYGITITNLLKVIVNNKDGKFIISELYRPTNTSLERAVERAVKSFSIDSKYAEGKGSELKEDDEIRESDRSYPEVIVIPESGRVLSKIVAAIKKFNVDEREYQIVGSSQWDDISTLNDENLIGAWFPAPENAQFRNFEKNYYEIFNKYPPRISSISYDSVAAVAALVDRKKGKDLEFSDFISYGDKKTGFEGIDGLFRYLPNGLVQRNLAVLEVADKEFKTIEKPVQKFLNY